MRDTGKIVVSAAKIIDGLTDKISKLEQENTILTAQLTAVAEAVDDETWNRITGASDD